MAATKRNAGLTSAVPRASLNDEELVSCVSSQGSQGSQCIMHCCVLVIMLIHNNPLENSCL